MTKIINLDSLKQEALIIIEVEGKRHEMKTASVDSFIENMKAIEGLGLNASPIQEIEVIIGIVARAFPTLDEKQIRSWPITTIQHLSEVARGVNGEIATADEAAAKEAAASGNAQKAS